MSLDVLILDAFALIVGREYLSIQPSDIDSLSRTTLPTPGTRPLGVIRPANREQVQEIVRVASAHHIPLYPISTGKNWGYGDACAPVDGCLIVDLSRMNRIVEVNTELAYAVLEPGVTQGQLSDHLQKNNIPLMMDCTGAGPDASWIGNTLERGFGHSAYGDRFAHSCNYEAVLADGTLMSTGLGSYPNAQAQHLYKWGIGPSLDGLLTQSNLAIVTRMTVWLMPKPASVEYYFITLQSPEAIGDLVEALRKLRLQGTIRSQVHCLNQSRLVASRRRYPWDQADGKKPLETEHPDLYHLLTKSHSLPAWAAIGILMGSPAETAAMRRTLQKELRHVPGLDRLVFLNEKRFEWASRLAGIIRCVAPNHLLVKSIAEVRLGMEMLRGMPAYETLRGGHWRARTNPGPAQDALDTQAGLIWISPVLPMTSQALKAFTALAEPLVHHFGFEYQVTLSCTTERAISAILSICFDKSNSEETARAHACSMKLTDALISAGLIPYRGSPSILDRVRQAAPEYWKAIGKLKHAWDPDSIIAPGRYIPDVK